MTRTPLTTDARGVSEVIGSILVFGLVVSLVAMLQMHAVPNANEEVEFEHSSQVANDLTELGVAVSESVDTGRQKEASVRLGASYPPRLLFFNPPSASGQLRTSDEATIQISNADASGNLGTYLAEDPELGTRSLNYSVRYNELSAEPVHVREAAVYYESHDGEAIVQNSRFVDGRTISLVAVGGEYAERGVRAATVSAEPLSAPAREYTVTERDDPIAITIPTSLSEDKWDEILREEYAGSTSPLSSESVPGSGYVTDASYTENSGPNSLTVVLAPGEEYTLRLGKVGFGDVSGDDPTPRYLVPVGDDDPSAATVEVRDGFNNPVSGVDLTINGTGATVTTGTNGRASYRPSSGTTVTFEADLDGKNGVKEPLERITVSTMGPPDPNPPAIDPSATTVQTDRTETCDGLTTAGTGSDDLPPSALVCSGSFRTLEQHIVEFQVSDDTTSQESGIAYVEIRILDSGNLVTKTRVAGNGQRTLTGRWVSPWLDDGGTNRRMDPDAVEIAVVDRSGQQNSTTRSL